MATPAGEKPSKPTFRDFYGDVHEDVGSSKGHWVYDKGQRSWRSGPPPKFKLSHRRVGDHLAQDKEWLAGPAARDYRRPATEAREMTIESCPDGAKIKRSDTDVLSKPSTICNLCRKTSPEPLKRCARCLAVSYCSKDCQQRDFKKHQIFCCKTCIQA